MQSATLSELGMLGDRQLMVLRDQQFINQKTLPRLATISARRISATEIEFSAPGQPMYHHRVAVEGAKLVTDLYGAEIQVISQGAELADWMSAAVGEKVELVSHASTSRRHLPVPPLAGLDGLEHAGFVDVSPLLLTNESSLADLNQRLSTAVGMDRFRPNIVVRGLAPWAEDLIDSYHSSQLSLHRKAQCERCAVTCTDQHTGERQGEPLRTLRTFRKTEHAYSSGIVFGAYLSITGDTVLSVGDKLEWRSA